MSEALGRPSFEAKRTLESRSSMEASTAKGSRASGRCTWSGLTRYDGLKGGMVEIERSMCGQEIQTGHRMEGFQIRPDICKPAQVETGSSSTHLLCYHIYSLDGLTSFGRNEALLVTALPLSRPDLQIYLYWQWIFSVLQAR